MLKGLSEGPEGLLEGPEGLLGGRGGMDGRTDGWMDKRTDGLTDGRMDGISPHSTGRCPLSGPLPCYYLRLHNIKEAGQGNR